MRANLEQAKNFRAEFEATLIFDVIRSQKRAQQSNHPADRRDLIRTIVTSIEGLVWAYKNEICDMAMDLGDLDDLEREALAERTVYVSNDGKLSERQRFLPVTTVLRLITNIAKRIEPSLHVDFGTQGWVALKETIETRNRITHPKSVGELRVEEDDIDIAFAALNWVMEVTLTSSEAVLAVLRHYAKNLRRFSEALKKGDERAIKLYELARSNLND